MATLLTARIDTRPLEQLATKLDEAARGVALRLSAVEACNAVTTRFKASAQRGMNAGLNLSDEYVASRMFVTPAVPSGRDAVRSEITTRGDLTIVGRFPHEQLRRAGTAVRSGLTRGRRPSGARVDIKKGQPVVEPQWFIMRLRRGLQPGDNEGLFVRTSDGRLKHLYGPSPYSLFRYQIGAQQQSLLDDLERTAGASAAATIERIVT